MRSAAQQALETARLAQRQAESRAANSEQLIRVLVAIVAELRQRGGAGAADGEGGRGAADQGDAAGAAGQGGGAEAGLRRTPLPARDRPPARTGASAPARGLTDRSGGRALAARLRLARTGAGLAVAWALVLTGVLIGEQLDPPALAPQAAAIPGPTRPADRPGPPSAPPSQSSASSGPWAEPTT
ncbi:hypothetical protein [Kitasatospora sp. NPDC004289]